MDQRRRHSHRHTGWGAPFLPLVVKVRVQDKYVIGRDARLAVARAHSQSQPFGDYDREVQELLDFLEGRGRAGVGNRGF